MRNEVRVLSLDKRFKKLERGVEGAASFFLTSIGEHGMLLEVYLIGNPRIRVLNRLHRDKDYPTNVLAFEAPKNFPDSDSDLSRLGEVYLNVPYISNHREDLNYLLLHGILHLLGFNHENKSDRMSMEEVEQKLMRWLNHKS